MRNVNDFPVVECKQGQSALDAANQADYAAPRFRIGATAEASPQDGESLIAYVKVSRHSRPLPIFERRYGAN